MLDIILAGFLIGLTHAMPPGPITMEVLKRGVSEGFASALKVDAGSVTADAIFFVLVAIGLNQLLAGRTGHLAMWLCGCVLLSFLGIRGIFRVLKKTGSDSRKWSGSPFLSGFLICITSPFALIWWTGVFSGMMIIGYTPSSLIGLFVGISLSCLVWYAFIGFLGSTTKGLLSKAWISALSLLCSLMMLGFAAILFYRGLSMFLLPSYVN